jgi:RimJ/RimL family protein N-acetyltransferase
MKASSRIQTERLLLSPPADRDVQDIFDRFASDPDVTRYLGWPQHRSLDDTRGFVTWSVDQWARYPAGPYLVRDRGDGRLLGSTGFTCDDEGGAMTGYVLARDSWGRGFATECLRAILDVARTIELPRVYAFCHPDHRPSQRVLEKCGFLRDESTVSQMVFPNLAPGVPQDTLCYVRWP